MSTWRFVIAETATPDTLRQSIEDAIREYEGGLSDEADPIGSIFTKSDSPSRVRFYSHDTDYPFWDAIRNAIESGEIENYDWLVLASGNDTVDRGSVEVFVDGEKIDSYSEDEHRTGIETEAYLERIHGIKVRVLPESMGTSYYNPVADYLRWDPDQTIPGESPEPPFDVGSPKWLRFIRDMGDVPEAPQGIELKPVDLGGNIEIDDFVSEKGRVMIYDFVFYHRERYPDRQTLSEWIESEMTVPVILTGGDGSQGWAELFNNGNKIDTVEGQDGWFGTDVARYLEEHHDVAVKTTPIREPHDNIDVSASGQHRHLRADTIPGWGLETPDEPPLPDGDPDQQFPGL